MKLLWRRRFRSRQWQTRLKAVRESNATVAYAPQVREVALDDEHESVREEAALRLREMGRKPGTDAILYQSDDWQLRRDVVREMRPIEKGSQDFFHATLSDKHELVQVEAALQLAKLGCEDGADTLMTYLRGNRVLVVGKTGSQVNHLYLQALESLIQLRDARVVEYLILYVTTPSVQSHVEAWLDELDPNWHEWPEAKAKVHVLKTYLPGTLKSGQSQRMRDQCRLLDRLDPNWKDDRDLTNRVRAVLSPELRGDFWSTQERGSIIVEVGGGVVCVVEDKKTPRRRRTKSPAYPWGLALVHLAQLIDTPRLQTIASLPDITEFKHPPGYPNKSIERTVLSYAVARQLAQAELARRESADK